MKIRRRPVLRLVVKQGDKPLTAIHLVSAPSGIWTRNFIDEYRSTWRFWRFD